MFSIWGAKQHAARTREAAHHMGGGCAQRGRDEGLVGTGAPWEHQEGGQEYTLGEECTQQEQDVP